MGSASMGADPLNLSSHPTYLDISAGSRASVCALYAANVL